MTDVKAFLEGLRSQREKYREMAAVLGEQRKLTAPDLDSLMAMVEKKRALMAEIEALDGRLAPVKERWPELRGDLEEGVVRQVEETVEETRTLLAELIKLEDEGRALLKEQRERAAEELRVFMKRKKAQGAYGDRG